MMNRWLAPALATAVLTLAACGSVPRQPQSQHPPEAQAPGGAQSQPTSPANQPPDAKGPTSTKPVATDAPATVVTQYFSLAAAGDYAAARKLIYPAVWNVAARTGSQAEQKFLAQKPAPKLVKASEGQVLDEWKAYSTQQRLTGVATVNVELGNGSKKTLHLATDDTGAWRLFYNASVPDPDLE